MIYGLYAAYVKLAAFLLLRAVVSWKHAFIFISIFFAISIVFRAESAASDVSFPPIFGGALGVLANIGLGAWFFSSRGRTAQGIPFGWTGGLKLTALSLCLIAVTLAVLQGIVGFPSRLP